MKPPSESTPTTIRPATICLAKPTSEDPVRRLNAEDVLTRGMAQIGYAALRSSGIRTCGMPSKSNCAMWPSATWKCSAGKRPQAGVPRERLFAHGAGWKEGELLYDVPVNPHACPGWSFYSHAADPRKDSGVQRNWRSPTRLIGRPPNGSFRYPGNRRLAQRPDQHSRRSTLPVRLHFQLGEHPLQRDRFESHHRLGRSRRRSEN